VDKATSDSQQPLFRLTRRANNGDRHSSRTTLGPKCEQLLLIDTIEARIDGAYTTHVERELSTLGSRIETAYRDVEADARVEAGTAEARRLRVVVAILLAMLVMGGVAVALLLLGIL
jgi:hypothetical protein